MSFTPIESQRCRADFPALTRLYGGRPLVFFDGPGGTQVPLRVVQTLVDAYGQHNANRGGFFPTSAELETAMTRARQIIADFLGAESASCISLGANMTTLNFALSHALERTLAPGDEIVVTQLDHEANRAPWMRLDRAGIGIREVRLNADGRLDEADLRAKIGARTKLVAMGYSSNALGTVNEVELARELSAAVGAYLLVDAVHSAPHFVTDVARLGTDFLICSAYKFYGPHVGILYCRPGLLEKLPTDVLPVQEHRAPYLIETGTLNHPAMEAAAAAVEYIASWGEGVTLRAKIIDAMQGIGAYEHALGRYYFEEVRKIRGVTVWGPDFTSHRRAPTVSITLEGASPRVIARQLAAEGICVWDGDFYAASAIEALGLASRGGLLRTGFSMYNQAAEVDRLLEALRRICY